MKVVLTENIKDNIIIINKDDDILKTYCEWAAGCPFPFKCSECPADLIIEKVTREEAIKWWEKQ